MLAVEEGIGGVGGRLFYDTLALMIVCNILDNTISVTFLYYECYIGSIIENIRNDTNYIMSSCCFFEPNSCPFLWCPICSYTPDPLIAYF